MELLYILFIQIILLLPLFIISALFYRSGEKEVTLIRVLKSSHGLLLVLAYSYGMVFFQSSLFLIDETYKATHPYILYLRDIPFLAFYILWLCSAIYSFFNYGTWLLKLLILIEIPYSIMILFGCLFSH